MNGIREFEDLRCWQQARQLVITVFKESMTGPLSRDFGTRDQLRRASLSVMNNIAEGFGRSSPKEFVRFLDFAQSSCMEVKSICYTLQDLNYVSAELSTSIRKMAEENKATIRALMIAVRKSYAARA